MLRAERGVESMKSQETINKYKNMKTEELEAELGKAYLEANKIRLEIEARKNQNISESKKSRINIARIKTILNSRESE